MLFCVGVCIAQRGAVLRSLRRRQSLRVGQRPPQENDSYSRLMGRLIGISQGRGQVCPGMSVVGCAEIRHRARGTPETQEYDTPVLVEGRGSTAKLDGRVIGRDCLLVSPQ